jgi:hypothetical protein
MIDSIQSYILSMEWIDLADVEEGLMPDII